MSKVVISCRKLTKQWEIQFWNGRTDRQTDRDKSARVELRFAAKKWQRDLTICHISWHCCNLGRLSSLQNVTLSITKYLQMSSSFLCSEPLSSVSTFSDVLHTVPFYFNLVLSNESYTGVKRTLEIAHYRKYLKHRWSQKIRSDTLKYPIQTPCTYSKSWGKNLVVRRIVGLGIVTLG